MKLMALMTAFLFCAPAWSVSIGESMPTSDFKMKNVDGKEMSVSDRVGEKGTLVIFSCNHCPWAKAWEERITKLGNVYQDKGIGVVMINSNDPNYNKIDRFEIMQKRAKKAGMKFPYLADPKSKMARLFGAKKTPEAFLFDASQKLVYHGAIDDNSESPKKVEKHYLRDALDKVATDQSIAKSMASTKAIGCGIKFADEQEKS